MSQKPARETVKGDMLEGLAFGVKPFGLVIFGAAVADGETITIGDQVYEFDTDSDVASGSIALDVSGGATAADAVAALKAAINANTVGGVTAADGNASNGLILTFTGGGASDGSLTVSETMDEAGNVVSSIDGGAANAVGPYTYTADALDVSEGQIVLTVTPPYGKTLYDVSVAVVSVSDGAVTKKAWDGAAAIDTDVVTIDNSGSTDFAAADKVVVTPVFG